VSREAPELEYAVDDFSPGYRDSGESSRLPKGATPSAANCLFSSKGEKANLSKRTGCRVLDVDAMSLGDAVDALYAYTREGVDDAVLLAICDGDLYAFDGTNTFTLVSALGMDPGATEFLTFRNLVQIMDGASQYLYDGTNPPFAVGFARPTAAPAIATTAPSGAGVTGTYQSLATWYDSVHDHESSPTDYGTATVFAAQARRHTKPTGSPPSHVDTWRVYVRKTSDNETVFKLVASVAIGTGTVTEEVADSARNLATNLIAPLPNANDVPPIFAFAATGLGYRFGVLPDDDYVWVSALGDPQGQHPKDKIGIERGDGFKVTTVKALGLGGQTTILVQKGTHSFYLQGDRMPFLPKDLSGSFGNVAQGASVEAHDLYWGWDQERGPYVTDLGDRWDSLVDTQIETIFRTINKTGPIRCAHVKEKTLVVWIVALNTSVRPTVMLAYDYERKAWLPPITGLDYASIAAFKPADDAAAHLYVGDAWGRVFHYFVDDIEGVPSGTAVATVVSATDDTIVAGVDANGDAVAFCTDGDGLVGLPVGIVDGFDNWQFRTILSNTADTIVIDTTNGTPWSPVPDMTYRVVVGAINWFWSTPLIDWAAPMRRKTGQYAYAILRASGSQNSSVQVRARFNDTDAPLDFSESLELQGSAGWGTGNWGEMLWGSVTKQAPRRRLCRSFYGIQLQLSNRFPNEPVELITVGVTADGKRGRWNFA
jgi:hypothetical protein